MLLGILGWVLVGLTVGFIASNVVNLRGDDPIIGIGCALGGAIIGGVLSAIFSGEGVVAWNPWSLLIAAAGAIVAVIIYHAVRSRSISHDQQSIRRSY